MKKKYSLIIFAVLVLTLSACERAYPTTPQAALPTQPADFPQPVATSGMNIIETAGTQTAIATSGLPVPTASGGESQPVVVVPTNTIDPNAPVVSTALPSPTTGAPAVVSTPIPQVVQPTVQVSKPASYSLHEGEFPWCIARRFNVNPDELCSLSGISCTQNYYTPGTVLRIPQSGNIFPGSRALKAHPASYTVQSGDTIYSIACKFGDIDPANIPANSLTTGTTIQIP
jgi:LysM repeat protein